MSISAPVAAVQGAGAGPLLLAVHGLLDAAAPGVDPFDWRLPRQQPARATPTMLQASQQQWALRIRRTGR